jgi:hypothetical protein
LENHHHHQCHLQDPKSELKAGLADSMSKVRKDAVQAAKLARNAERGAHAAQEEAQGANDKAILSVRSGQTTRRY